MFTLGDKYSLEFHWGQAEYNQDNVCCFKDAYFSGPVLQLAQRISDNDGIRVDFYSQYITLVRVPYVGVLTWGNVSYSNDKVFLSDCTLKHPSELHKVPKLNNTDWFLIDTSKHSVENHANNLVYPTYVMNDFKDTYQFK